MSHKVVLVTGSSICFEPLGRGGRTVYASTRAHLLKPYAAQHH